MTLEEVKDFLRERPGYLGKGGGWLAKKLGCSEKKCKTALRAVRQENEVASGTSDEENENLIVSKVWEVQTKGGGKQIMKSYKNLQEEAPSQLDQDDWIEILKEAKKFLPEPLEITPQKLFDYKTLIVWTSDKHIGANIPCDALYKKEYNEHIYMDRIRQIFLNITDYAKTYGHFDQIIVADLGDSLDGFNNQTVRGGHALNQNLNNKEASRVHFFSHKWLYDSLIEANVCNKIKVVNVSNCNHSGDYGWQANFALEQYGSMAWPDIEFTNQEELMGHFEIYDKAYIVTHGKDKKNRKFGLPKYLNDKTENFIMDYVLEHRLTSKYIHVRKGDLHMDVVDASSKKMTYNNIGSVFGVSDWIMDNFGNGDASCQFELVREDSNNIKTDIIWLE